MSVKVMLEWNKVAAELIPPEFKTHFNYIDFLKKKSEGLQITESHGNLNKCEEYPKELERKILLINSFKKAFDREFSEVSKFHELAEMHNIWIATKSYYLLFHLWCIVRYLVSLDQNSINSSHSAVRKFIKSKVKEGTIVFNSSKFNEIKTYNQINPLHLPVGAQLKDDYDEREIESFIWKRIARAKLEEFKRTKNIKDFRKRKDKKERDLYEKSEDNALIEFFYIYRIKNNYQDMEFLNGNVKQELQLRYYNNYYYLTCNFYEALKKVIITLSKKRNSASLSYPGLL